VNPHQPPRRVPFHLLAVAAVATAAVAPAQAATSWLKRNFDGRASHAMTWDSARDRTVLFGGIDGVPLSETWEWDGSLWLQRTAPGGAPPARFGHALAYDSTRHRTVLYGGHNGGGDLGDTYEFDGSVWWSWGPAVTPGPLQQHAMVYDAASQRVLLFGGYANNLLTSNTWEWDGSNWTQRTPASQPSPRANTAMAYDSSRQRVVLFSGTGGGAETWEWDNVTWTLQNPATRPAGRFGHAMQYDQGRQRTVLFGGFELQFGGSYLGDTWEWDGSNWTQSSPVTAPAARNYTAMSYDGAHQTCIVFGGYSGSYLADTWAWDGSHWTLLPGAAGPSPRHDSALAYDAGHLATVLFGGAATPAGGAPLGDTWQWNGIGWAQQSPLTSPSPRSGHAMAYDGLRQRTVLFGGGAATPLADVYEYDGSTWTAVTASGPSARRDHAMLYDGARQRVLLFGGADASLANLGDTWEWDGTAWTQRAPAASPSPRSQHALAFDTIRNRGVLFGGSNGGRLADTWEWDGSNWAVSNPATSPPPAAGQAMAYDASRSRTVLVGGFAPTTPASIGDVWEWDGSNWTQRVFTIGPSLRSGGAVAYDSTSRRTVVFGGGDGYLDAADTWIYGNIQRATTSSFGTACQGTGGPATLTSSEPFLGNARFSLDLSSGVANSPCLFVFATTLHIVSIGSCNGYVGQPLAVTFNTTGATGFVSLPLPVPNTPSLRGTTLFCQAGVVDPLGAGGGIAVTNCRIMVIGD
jgi:hypothetical protein